VATAATLLLTATSSYLLQTNESLRPPRPQPAPPRIVVAQADPGGREYVVRRHQFVALGSSALTMPILMYHYVRQPPSIRTDALGFKLSVSPETFKTQMDWLAANGYHAVTFDQVRAYFAGVQPLPSRPFVITFDDGYQDLYTTAFPILEAHGFTAVAYVVSGFVGQSGYLDSQEILAMDHAGIEIGSHTVNHADLARLRYASLAYEVVQSKDWLERLVKHPVLDFAYPSGKFTSQTVDAVVHAGYSTAVTTSSYPPSHSLVDRYTWSRVRVGGGEELGDFITSLGGCMASTTITRVDVISPVDMPLPTTWAA